MLYHSLDLEIPQATLAGKDARIHRKIGQMNRIVEPDFAATEHRTGAGELNQLIEELGAAVAQVDTSIQWTLKAEPEVTGAAGRIGAGLPRPI